MKNLFKLPITISSLIVLVSCSAEIPNEPPVYRQVTPPVPGVPHEDPEENNDPYEANLYFGFLDGDGSSDTYIDMPIESSPTHLFVGRWKINKIGIDENNDGKIKHYNYENYAHKDCGKSFLQFNKDGVVFENSYYKSENSCTLYVEIDDWELIEPDRFKIYVYDIIYLLKVNETELILKYDWRFEGSLYAPVQVYYYYERILPTD